MKCVKPQVTHLPLRAEVFCESSNAFSHKDYFYDSIDGSRTSRSSRTSVLDARSGRDL